MVDNQRNINQKKSEYPDGCGTWSSDTGTTVKHSFSLSDQNDMVYLYTRDGIFNTRKSVKGKYVFEPCVPQPERVMVLYET